MVHLHRASGIGIVDFYANHLTNPLLPAAWILSTFCWIATFPRQFL